MTSLMSTEEGKMKNKQTKTQNKKVIFHGYLRKKNKNPVFLCKFNRVHDQKRIKEKFSVEKKTFFLNENFIKEQLLQEAP